MAAGLGFKDFQAGAVLTASDTNGYLASQANMVFATAAARDAAITSPQEGMVVFLKDSNNVFIYSGAAWIESSGIGAYTPFTPTLSNWTLGNGVFDAEYKVLGKLIHYYGTFEFGSTSAVGANPFNITLPVNARFGLVRVQYGSSQWRDVSLGVNVVGTTTMENSTNMFVNWNQVAALSDYLQKAAWTSAAGMPFTFATGDFVSWDIVYEGA
jgi:hypothetical protein